MRRDTSSLGNKQSNSQRHPPDQTTAMPDTVGQCSITLILTATAALFSGVFSPSILSTHRWSGSIQVRYNDYRSARPRLLRRPYQLLLFGRPWTHLSRPQRQVLYNASKGVNSLVGLEFFLGYFCFFVPIARFPQKKRPTAIFRFCIFVVP